MKVNVWTLLSWFVTSLSHTSFTGNAAIFGVSIAIWIWSKCAHSLTVLKPLSFQVTCSLAEYNKYNDYLKRVNVFNARKCGGTKVSLKYHFNLCHRRWMEVVFSLPVFLFVWLCVSRISHKDMEDLNKTWCIAWVCDKDKLIQFSWRYGSGFGNKNF